MKTIIEKKQIKEWLEELKKDFKVFDVRKSVLPAKQYLFPTKEKTFVFNNKSGELKTPENNKKDFIVFGLDLEDLEAMTQLDEIMNTPEPDFFYWQRREKSILVGLVDYSKDILPGGDIVLQKINKNQYKIRVLTEKGEQIRKSKFFKKTEDLKIKEYKKEKCEFKKLLLDPELLHDAVKWSKDLKIWDELGEKCLGCGNCTYVCPICHCFSIEDRVGLDGKTCTRCRYWDACTLPEFGEVTGPPTPKGEFRRASGHNFHKTIKERYYNWYYHKFVRAYKEYGKAQCVDCGRCHRYCPAGIDIEEVVIEICKTYISQTK